MENEDKETHGCIHEKDFIASKKDRNELFKRSDEKFQTLEYIKGELILIKDALGVKNKDNGTRDKQIQDIINKTTELEKLTDEGDNNLSENITQLQYDMREIKGFLKGYFQQKEEQREIDFIKKKKSQEIDEDEHIKSGFINDKFTLYSVLLAVLAIGIAVGLVIHLW